MHPSAKPPPTPPAPEMLMPDDAPMPHALPDEAALIGRIQVGGADGAEAFRTLYAHYFPRLYAYIAYRVGRVADAEDITADVFLRMVEALPRFEYRGAGSFAAWAFSIALRQVQNFYRTLKRKPPTLSLDEIPDVQGDGYNTGDSPDAALQRKERFRRLHVAIQGLSPRRQEIVTLRFFGGLKNREIAAILNLDERTIAAHVSRALKDLQAFYSADNDAERGEDER